MRLYRAGEIDYYEELGVDRNATPEDIHESFRALVRLLHPDRQRDEQLRSIAETQLRKVNRIYAVLSDPERRRRYDEALEENSRPPTIVFGPAIFKPHSHIDAKQFVSRIVWIGAAVLGVAIVIWFATDPPAAPLFSSPDRVIASSKPPVVPAPVVSDNQSDAPEPVPEPVFPNTRTGNDDENLQLRSALRAAQRERDEAKQELAQLRARQALLDRPGAPDRSHAPSGSAMTSAATSIGDLAPPRIVPVSPHATASALPPALRTVKPLGSDPHQFAGFWFFARSSQTKRNQNLYPPEFIEATLTEQNGVIHGKYRSRYRVVDRAISPDVNFEFSGTPASGAMACAWTGPGGARGQVTLQMTGENDIKVNWTASEVGSVQGLASGTATLTRRLE